MMTVGGEIDPANSSTPEVSDQLDGGRDESIKIMSPLDMEENAVQNEQEMGEDEEIPMLPSDGETPIRARVFALASDGAWEDLATGVFVLEDSVGERCQYFRVMGEDEDGEGRRPCLFEAVVTADKLLSLQNDSVLAWTPDDGTDMALSFEYAAHLSDIWHRVCMFQRRPPEYEYFGGHVKIALPEIVDPSTIPLIESSLSLYTNFSGLRNPLCELLQEQSYIPQLLDQFRAAKGRGDGGGGGVCGMVYRIFRMMVGIGVGMVEEMVREGRAEGVAEVFEEDPAMKEPKGYYRSFIKEEGNLKIVLPFASPTLESQIRRSIRLQFFKDVILPRHLDDDSFSALSHLTRSLLSSIIQQLDADPQHYVSLVNLLAAAAGSGGDAACRVQMLKFCREFIAISRTTTSNIRQLKFFQPPVFPALLSLLQASLSPPSLPSLDPSVPEVARLAAELLLVVVQLETIQVQTWISAQNPSQEQLMALVIERIHRDEDSSVRWHLVSVLRILLDPPNPLMGPNISSYESISDHFYTHHCLRLLSPLSHLPRLLQQKQEEMKILSDVQADMYFHLCELSSSFILLHKYKIKYLLIRDQIPTGICLLVSSRPQKHAFLRLAGLRLLRTLLSLNDDFYIRILISIRVFDHLLAALTACSSRNNLLRAALLDFFCTCLAAPNRQLIDSLVIGHRQDMERLGSLHEVFPRLLQLYDSNYACLEKEAENKENDMGDKEPVQGDRWASVDHREEDYFSSDAEAEVETVLPAQDAVIADPVLPTLGKKPDSEAEEFGGALTNTTTDKQASPPKRTGSLFGAGLKNSLRVGLSLFKSSNPATGAAEETGSPSKKTKHA